MKMGLRIVASIINISFDGRPPVSLGTAVVDLLTIIPCSSDEMLGSVLCARKAHLFSEQERNKGAIYIALLRSCKRKQTSIYKHFIPTGFMCPRNLLRKQELRPLLHRLSNTDTSPTVRKNSHAVGSCTHYNLISARV